MARGSARLGFLVSPAAICKWSAENEKFQGFGADRHNFGPDEGKS